MKILFDGMNLSLRKGTGVATYARNLASTAKALGHEVHILHGEDISRSRNPLALEAEFFSAGGRRSAGRLKRLSRQMLGLVDVAPWRVPLSDKIEKREISGRLPTMDFLWNWPDLFAIAHRHFALTGRFLTVKNVPKVDVAHWTYPVPIRLHGAKNIYTIHDLVPIKLPYTTLDRKNFYVDMIEKICKMLILLLLCLKTLAKTS